MDCNDNSSLTPSPDFVSPPPESSSALLYNFNYSNYNYNSDQFWPVLEMKKAAMEGCEEGGNNNNNNITIGGSGVGDQKVMMKKRLNQNQLAALERSFQEEVKVDPDRKMKLSKELGLQPRQVAVWFQNRRARWKAKQLELLYHTLKQQFDTISQEKHFLQQEVMKLRSMLREQAAVAGRNHGSSVAHTDVSGEETTVESTSVGIRSCNNDSYMIYNSNNMEDFNQISAASAPPEAFWWADANHHPSYP